ncbi:MAG TPA: UdgX family uracil-DNA binding protein [Gemmatimonadaceae bacterium]
MTQPRSAASRPPSWTGSAADFMPARRTLPALRAAAAGCHGCDLWLVGTQTVFGEGPSRAAMMLVGEQPGDQEDREGHPFVGPSGRVLDAALEEAGIDRDSVYVTNAVKHFKWERGERGKRRIHKKPNDMEIRACRPWLDAEIASVRPRVIVCLGATAAQALLGKQFRVTRERGRAIPTDYADAVIATVHPSAVLRAPPATRERAEREFRRDIRAAAALLERVAVSERAARTGARPAR